MDCQLTSREQSFHVEELYKRKMQSEIYGHPSLFLRRSVCPTTERRPVIYTSASFISKLDANLNTFESQTHLYTYWNIHEHMPVCMHTYIRPFIYTYIRTQIHITQYTSIRKYASINKYILCICTFVIHHVHFSIAWNSIPRTPS